MKLFILSAAILVVAISSAICGDVYVPGRVGSDGTYHEGYHRTTSDGNAYNNYGTQGNSNPWTGKVGTVDPNAGSNYGGGYKSKRSSFGY